MMILTNLDAKTLNSNTSEEVFQCVAYHLLKQNAKSYDEFGDCLYRSADGSKCAVGCLISDEDYKDSYESTNIEDIDLFKNTQHLNLLTKLQIIHDCSLVDEWRKELQELADVEGYNFESVLQALELT